MKRWIVGIATVAAGAASFAWSAAAQDRAAPGPSLSGEVRAPEVVTARSETVLDLPSDDGSTQRVPMRVVTTKGDVGEFVEIDLRGIEPPSADAKFWIIQIGDRGLALSTHGQRGTVMMRLVDSETRTGADVSIGVTDEERVDAELDVQVSARVEGK